jgi:hypothetical protein
MFIGHRAKGKGHRAWSMEVDAWGERGCNFNRKNELK